MKKQRTLMILTILLTGCGKGNLVKGVCLENDICPSPYIYYETLERIMMSERAMIETEIVGYLKDNNGMRFEVLDDLTEEELDFYIKLDTAKNVYSYKLNEEEKLGIFYGEKVEERTEWFTVEHSFEIPGTDFDSKEKYDNKISFVAVLKSDDSEVRLIAKSFYSRLNLKTIIFSNQ